MSEVEPDSARMAVKRESRSCPLDFIMDDLAVGLNNVSEVYDVEMVLNGRPSREKVFALRDINLCVRKGESVAVLGSNGAGKSTLLRLIAGLLEPDQGEIRVAGRVGSLLDLGCGFHPELTGRDNLLLNASLYSFTKAEFGDRLEQILSFADIGKFIDAPLRCYSQGMYVRLAFSLAIHINPDVLLIDDCLAVGDRSFQMKCLDRILELKEKKTTVIFVTHDTGLAKEVCERGLYIKDGRLVKDAAIEEVVAAYSEPLQVDKESLKYLGRKLEIQEKDQKQRLQDEQRRWTEAEARIREEERLRWEEEEKQRRQEEGLRRQEEEKQRLQDEQKRWTEAEARIREEERLRWEKEEKQRLQDEQRRWTEAEDRIREEERQLRIREVERLREQMRQDTEAAVKERDRLLRKEEAKRQRSGLFHTLAEKGRFRLYYDKAELTAPEGLRTFFVGFDGREYFSDGAFQRVRKISEREAILYFRWPRPLEVFQAWKITLHEDALDIEIIAQIRRGQWLKNERIELCLSGRFHGVGRGPQDNKTKNLYVEGDPSVNFVSLSQRQVSRIERSPTGCPALYFLNIPDWESRRTLDKHRYIYFKGRIETGRKPKPKKTSTDTVSLSLSSGFLDVFFKDGSCQLFREGRSLTAGLGIYSSFCSKGTWHDSTQALWKVKESSQRKIVVEGVWPWIAISQIWEISLSKGPYLGLCIEMIVHEREELAIRETALLLPEAYEHWSVGEKTESFPDVFTSDDYFRYCLWQTQADAETKMTFKSSALPSLAFKAKGLKHHKLILENAGHIYRTKARLIHFLCDRHGQDGQGCLEPGRYEFFQGEIKINGEVT